MNHHKRKDYENMLIILSKESGLEKPILAHLSDYDLLTRINVCLLKLNCLPMNEDELEVILE
jgi:hypothetical protein